MDFSLCYFHYQVLLNKTSKELEQEYSIEDFKKVILDPEYFEQVKKECYIHGLAKYKCRWNVWRVCLGIVDNKNEETIR